MISVRFQGKPFNITVIQVYAPTSNAEEAEVERFSEDLQDLLELTSKKDVLFIIGAAAAAKSLQSCPTLCNPIDGSPPGSPVPGILQARTLEWAAIALGEFNSDDHYIYYCGQESLRRNGVAIMVNKRVRNAVLGCNLKNDRMISVRFQANHSISQ